MTFEPAPIFKALGDPTRLRIFEFLRTCCGPVAVEETGAVRTVMGPTVGEVCCHVTGIDKVTSSISFHLKELRLAGLVTMERRGKTMVCSVNSDVIAMLASYFGSQSGACERTDCCTDTEGDKP